MKWTLTAKPMLGGLVATVVVSMALSACTVLQPVKASSHTSYAIEASFGKAAPAAAGTTLLVSTPVARAGFDSQRMVYQQKAHTIDYFAQNQWVDSPARMMAPLLQQALESTASYRAVLTPRSPVAADLRLDTELVRLQQEFITHPSQVRLTLRAQLLDLRSKTLLASREFEVVEAASSEDPYGGVLATNKAVKQLLQQVADFCVEASR